MLWARSLLLIGLATAGVSTGEGRAQSLFPFPIPLPSVPSPPHPGAASLPFPSAPWSTPDSQAYLPSDADPNYSTPGGFDKDVNFSLATRKEVSDPTAEPPGTITINTGERKLYLSLGDGRAIQYGIGVGRQGFSWKGVAAVGRKAFWPGWTPPPEMLARQPELPDHMDGGMENPLGARALYLFQGNKDTLFRIHGTNEPKSIGHAVSSGCIRMLDSDVIDLYQRVAKGTRVVVL
jgi:lipoprotein-anchoring transpeptidase ErfK/SrfK